MQYCKISEIVEGTLSYDLLANGKGNVLFMRYVVDVLSLPAERALNSSYNTSDRAIKDNDYGFMCIEKKTDKLLGYVLSKRIGNGRENEITVCCSPDTSIIEGLLRKHCEWVSSVLQVKVLVFIPAKEELIELYENCGFVVVDRISKRYPTEPNIAKMIYSGI